MRSPELELLYGHMKFELLGSPKIKLNFAVQPFFVHAINNNPANLYIMSDMPDDATDEVCVCV